MRPIVRGCLADIGPSGRFCFHDQALEASRLQVPPSYGGTLVLNVTNSAHLAEEQQKLVPLVDPACDRDEAGTP